MPQSLARVIIHITFSTKHRYPFLSSEEIRQEVHAYLGGTCNKLGCTVIRVGGSSDHVHILCALSRTMSVAQLVEELKKGSSKWVKAKSELLRKFSWQSGYGVFSVSEEKVATVSKYIAGQGEHHRRQSFQEEYVGILKTHTVSFDERYLWD